MWWSVLNVSRCVANVNQLVLERKRLSWRARPFKIPIKMRETSLSSVVGLGEHRELECALARRVMGHTSTVVA